ncbi:MAG: hypothetical protein KF708_07130 [Pirellulales bacterium]|nr:hypothetical protein [Pirellulales bacterium]
MPLIAHPTGNYSFLPGIAPYSCGAIAQPGYEIVHVTFLRQIPYRAGMERIAALLAEEGRPRAALCGVELRSPTPYCFGGFAEFNAGYSAILEDWGVFVGGVNPVARTNVAPAVAPPVEPSVFGYSYTRPGDTKENPTFVVAGGGELPEGVLEREGIVALGDTSPSGIATKARFVMDLMENRLRGLGADWSLSTTVNVYTVHAIEPLLPRVLLGRMDTAGARGVQWCYSRPPVEEIEYEMDLRGVRTELVRE